MNEGSLLLTAIPQADGGVKNRPVVALRELPPYRDLLVCGVSTQLHRQVEGFDDLISRSDDDFLQSGLKTASLIRLSFLAVLPKRSILGSIGSVSQERHRRLLKRLSEYLVR